MRKEEYSPAKTMLCLSFLYTVVLAIFILANRGHFVKIKQLKPQTANAAKFSTTARAFKLRGNLNLFLQQLNFKITYAEKTQGGIYFRR